MNKRADIICYDRNGKAVLLVECKASSVKINQSVFEQIARYNFELKVPYLLVTNGLKHYCCQMNYEVNSFTFLEDIPSFSTIESSY
jgi:type I site-specific restriction endonuclease